MDALLSSPLGALGWAAPFQAASFATRNGAIVHGDAFQWLASLPADSLSGLVFDPPYSAKEYDAADMKGFDGSGGGTWRTPPAFDGLQRTPVPRFTALSQKSTAYIHDFFRDLAAAALPALRPGAHVVMASNVLLSLPVFGAMVAGGLEFRGQLIRVVSTLRGGDRPRYAEEEFSDTNTMPRGAHEPWGIFRKPLPPGATVRDCLREYGTGALRRRRDGTPLADMIQSERTPQKERALAGHPNQKPQAFLREIVWSALPLGSGVLADPFMGSGSTVAAADALGYTCIGVERSAEFFDMARSAIPRLATIKDAAACHPMLDLPPPA